MDIGEEIQQFQWASLWHKAAINIMLTSRVLEAAADELLKGFGISQAQFNILRILRGQKGRPATVKLLTERMLDKSSNASRLVDRLMEKGLVHRVECPDDRRAVEVTLTQAGAELLSQVDGPMDRLMAPLSVFPQEDARLLSDLLDRFRETFRSAPTDLSH